MADIQSIGPEKQIIFGTDAERTGRYTTDPPPVGTYFWVISGATNLGKIFLWDAATWLGPYTAAQVGLNSASPTQTASEAEIVDNTGANIYEGYAPFGTATSAAAWKILRTPVSGTVTGPTQRADGNDNYDNVWDSRATLSYT